jgi:hypothetical protein
MVVKKVISKNLLANAEGYVLVAYNFISNFRKRFTRFN